MINTTAQALENIYAALGGEQDVDKLTVPQILDLIATVASSGGGGGGGGASVLEVNIVYETEAPAHLDKTFKQILDAFPLVRTKSISDAGDITYGSVKSVIVDETDPSAPYYGVEDANTDALYAINDINGYPVEV